MSAQIFFKFCDRVGALFARGKLIKISFATLVFFIIAGCSSKPDVTMSNNVDLQASIGFANSTVITFKNINGPFKILSVDADAPLQVDQDNSTCYTTPITNNSCDVVIVFRPSASVSGSQDIKINYSYNNHSAALKDTISYSTLAATYSGSPDDSCSEIIDPRFFSKKGELIYNSSEGEGYQYIFAVRGNNMYFVYPAITSYSGTGENWSGPGYTSPPSAFASILLHNALLCSLPYIFNNTNIASLNLEVDKVGIDGYGNDTTIKVMSFAVTQDEFKQINYDNILEVDLKQIGDNLKFFSSP